MEDEVIKISEMEADNFLAIINTFAINLLKSESTQDISWSVVKDAVGQLGFADCVVYVNTEHGLVQMAAHGSKNPGGRKILNPMKLHSGVGIVGHVLKTGKSILVNDTSLDERYVVDDEVRLSELAVPIILEDEVIGVIDSEHPSRNFFSQRHVQILTTIATLTATKLGQALARQALKKQNVNLEGLVSRRTSQLEKSLARIEEINDDLYHFTYALTHDLRQPLHSILGLTEIALMEKPDESMVQILDKIRNVSDCSLGLIDEIMKYAALDAEDTKRFDWVDMNEIIQKVINNLNNLLRIDNIKLNIPDLPRVFCIEHLFLQVFQNLISNAIKYRKPDVPLDISLEYEIYDQHIFHIKDNGLGISKEYQKNIFTIFSRGTNHTDSEGFGVGLAVCKKILQKHGGSIIVESEPGKGSTFTIRLPFYPY